MISTNKLDKKALKKHIALGAAYGAAGAVKDQHTKATKAEAVKTCLRALQAFLAVRGTSRFG